MKSQRIASQPSASVRNRAMNLPLTLSAGVPYEVSTATPGKRCASVTAVLNCLSEDFDATPRSWLLLRPPLEAERVAVGVEAIELLHAVRRDFGLLDVEPFGTQVPVRGVDIGAANEEDRVGVDPRARGVRCRRAIVGLVKRVQHELGFAELQIRPVTIVAGHVRGGYC